MAVLCQLADPEHYRPFDWSLVADPADLEYWLGLFAGFPRRERCCADSLAGPISVPLARFCEYAGGITALAGRPAGQRRSCDRLLQFRPVMLIKHGFPDPYAASRRGRMGGRPCIPASSADRPARRTRWETLLRALFAGNCLTWAP